MPRPTWDEYFMRLAMVARTRSPDPDTKHGAIVVSPKNLLLGQGYNGWPRGGGEESYPDERPAKYRFMVHAEINALLHRAPGAEGGTIYVTGLPCCECFKAIIQVGIKRVVCGPVVSAMIDEADQHAIGLMSRVHDVTLARFDAWPEIDR